MKGITPVIATILLLLITVSMAGFAFIFLQRSLENTAASTEAGLQEQQNQMRQKVAIDTIDAATGIVYVRSSGTVAIDVASKVTLYMNDTLVSCSWSAPWVPGTTQSCDSGPPCSGSTKITVVAPGGRDSTTC